MLLPLANSILQELRVTALIATKRILKKKLNINTNQSIDVDSLLDRLHCPAITKKNVINACDALAKSLVKPAQKFLSFENKGELWEIVLAYLSSSYNTKRTPDQLNYSEAIKQKLQTLGYQPEDFGRLLNKASKKLEILMQEIDKLLPNCIALAESSASTLDMPE